MSIFKDTFTTAVQTQLKQRQDAISKRTPTSIRYLNSRNAWIKMTSSVNVDGLNDIADLYILKGGILSPFGLKAGVGNEGAYSRFTPGGDPNQRGLRPMPGINSIDIKSKSAYGSLREVNVNFQAWDIKQLEDLELLYMRPGYTVLIEWGWLPFLDNNGTLQTNITGGTYDIIRQTPTKEKIWEDLFNKSKALGGNYDAMFGYVKNYGWSARPDGGYDCTTSIISIGEIVESLKVNYTPLNIDLSKTSLGLLNIKPIGDDIEKKYQKNILAGLFAEMYKVAVENKDTAKVNDKGRKYNIVDKDKTYEFFLRKSKVTNSSEDSNKLVGSSANEKHVYIKLKSLIDVLNKYVILADNRKNKNTPLVEVSLKERVYDKDINSSDTPYVPKDLYCLSHPLQISVDPTICLIGNDLWSNIQPPPQTPPTGSRLSVDIEDRKFIPNVLEEPNNIPSSESTKYLKNLDSFFLNESKELGIIGNIYVNLQFLFSLSLDNNLESQDKKEKQEIAIYDFLKNIMSQVSSCIGNVNNFDIHVDPVDNKARIIDINYVDDKSKKEAYDKTFELQIHNLQSTVRNYKLESQIFPEQSTIVAIGSQVQGGALGTDSNTMSGFNRNITDRIIPAKTDPNVVQKESEEQTKQTELANLQKNIKLVYDFFADTTPEYIFWSQAAYDVTRSGEYKGALRDLIKGLQSLTNDKNKYNAIIPTKLSFEMDGIGGLVIGHLFRIPDNLLPKGYKGVAPNTSTTSNTPQTASKPIGHKLGYIVTGIGHKIQNNDWVTNVDSQTIVLDDPTNGIDVDYKTLLNFASQALKENRVISSDEIATVTVTKGDSIKQIYEPALSKVTSTRGLKLLAEGHSVIEGFFPESRGFRNNNPGNLTMNPLLVRYGAVLEPANVKGERRFAKFPTLELGIKAKIDYIQRIIDGKHKSYPKDPSLSTYISKYAPSTENDTEGYIKKMIKWFATNGVTITRDIKLSQIKNLK